MAVMNRIENDHQNGFSIGQLANATGVPKSTMRHWEREFRDFLETARLPGKERRFAPDAAEKVERIKTMVEDQGLTLRGVRLELERMQQRSEMADGPPPVNNPIEDKARRLADMVCERLARRLME